MRRRLSLLLWPLAAALAVACAESDADVSITTKVRAKLDADRVITNASPIQVTTNKKVVTLSGPVQTNEARTQAVKLARSTERVKEVVDQLTVAPGAGNVNAGAQQAAPPAPSSESPPPAPAR
jgi:hypothetical protein